MEPMKDEELDSNLQNVSVNTSEVLSGGNRVNAEKSSVAEKHDTAKGSQTCQSVTVHDHGDGSLEDKYGGTGGDHVKDGDATEDDVTRVLNSPGSSPVESELDKSKDDVQHQTNVIGEVGPERSAALQNAGVILGQGSGSDSQSPPKAKRRKAVVRAEECSSMEIKSHVIENEKENYEGEVVTQSHSTLNSTLVETVEDAASSTSRNNNSQNDRDLQEMHGTEGKSDTAGENAALDDKMVEQTCESSEDQYQLPDIEYDFSAIPKSITGAWKEFSGTGENFLKGCKWSPDGTCLLTNSNDNRLRLFNLPTQLWLKQRDGINELSAVLKMREGDLIYDYCWYPRMSSMDPVSCCLVSCSRDNPIHMWDAFTGELRCSYRPYNNVDEIAPAYSVAFTNAGDKLFCGFNNVIRIFDINKPGRECVTIQTKGKKSKIPEVHQRGILSCIAVSPDDTMFAVGSYSKTVGVYCCNTGELISLVQGEMGGVTHLKLSPDGNYLYSGGRKDPEIVCWDMRNLGDAVFTMERQVETNQRMYFDLDRGGRYLVSGNHDGTISV